MRLPSHGEQRRFCEVEGWDHRRGANHDIYSLVLPSGEVLRTAVSRQPGGIDDPNLFTRILRDQLRVTPQAFWATVDKGIVPERPAARPTRSPGTRLPAWLASRLMKTVGLPPERVGTMTEEEARAAWEEWQAAPPPISS